MICCSPKGHRVGHNLVTEQQHRKIGIIMLAWADTASHHITSLLSFLFINCALVWFGSTMCLVLKEKKIQLNFPEFLVGRVTE